MNNLPLDEILRLHQGRFFRKIEHYIPIYERHFNKYRGTDVTVLEIGVWKGGSLQLWKSYFGENSRIIGIDIRPDCLEFRESGVEVEIGDQKSHDFLAKINEKYGPFSIVIDDGSHKISDVKASFNFLFPHIKQDGVYLVEDLHCAYWEEYGGGKGNKDNFIEISKNLIDDLNYKHWRDAPDPHTGKRQQPNYENMNLIHYYDSVVVIEKAKNTQFKHVKYGGV